MKLLITGGCSFSVAKLDCWPAHLEKFLNFDFSIHTGASCQGNDLISKKILHKLIVSLESFNPEDILVGIMWSAPNRKAVYLAEPKSNLPKLKGCPDNPNAVVDGQFNWYMLNSEDTILTPNYYKNFYSIIGSQMQTCEDILRVQWFLQKNNIKYFMSTYTNKVLPPTLKIVKEINYLYNQIDFDKFLPIDGEFEWCKKHYDSKFNLGDNHPTPEQHLNFTKEVILPFLEKNNYV